MAEELTYDPVVEGRSRQRVRLVGPLRPPPYGRALVLVPERGPALTVWPGDPVPAPRLGVYRSTVLVDTGEHRLVLPLQLPCGERDFTFRCRVTLLCRVVDPAAVVARGTRDVGSTVYGPVRALLTTAASGYGPTQGAAAAAALNSALRGFTGDTVVELRDPHVDLLVEADPAMPAPHTVRGEVLSRRDTPPDLNLLPGGAPASGGGGGSGTPRPSRVRTSGGASARRTSRVRGAGAGASGSTGASAGASAGTGAGPAAGGAPAGAAPGEPSGPRGAADRDRPAGGARGGAEPWGAAPGGGGPAGGVRGGGVPGGGGPWGPGDRGEGGGARAGAAGRVRRVTRLSGTAARSGTGRADGGAVRGGGPADGDAAEGVGRPGPDGRRTTGTGGEDGAGEREGGDKTWE